MTDLLPFVDAFEQSVRSTLALAESLDGPDWSRPTDLPGWTVQDVVAHLASVERELLGDPPPPPLDSYGPHVRDAFAQHMEDGIEARRGRPATEVVAELRDALELRLPRMREPVDPRAPAGAVPMALGWTNEELLRNRAFDAWMHEQDVRRAVQRPGNLDGPGAEVVRGVVLRSLPYVVAKRAGALPGQSVRLDVSGAVPGSVTVAVGDDGRAAIAHPSREPTARLSLDWEALVRLAGGRCRADDVSLEVAGDRDLAHRVAAGLTVTP